MIELVQLAMGKQNRGDFPEVLEIAAGLVGLTSTGSVDSPAPRARPQAEQGGKLHPLRVSVADSARRRKLADDEYSRSASASSACCLMTRQRGWSIEALEYLGVHEARRRYRKSDGGERESLVVRWPQRDLGGLLAGWRDRRPGSVKSMPLSAPGTAWPLVGIGPSGLDPGGVQVILFEGESDLTAAVTGMLDAGVDEWPTPLSIPGTGMLPVAADALASRGARVLVVHDDDDAGHKAWRETDVLLRRFAQGDSARRWVPQGGDYDDYCHQVGHTEAWRKAVDEAQA